MRKESPKPFDKDDIVEYDCSTRTQRMTGEGHRLSLTKEPLLLDLAEIADACFSENPEIKQTTWDSLENLVAMGFVRHIPDLTRKKLRLGYDNEPLADNVEQTISLYQVTQAGIDYLTSTRRITWSFFKWLVTTFVTAGWIALLLKLLGKL